MPSTVGWLDYSEEHRQRMREVIDLFRDRDTLDEIGVGSIRDTFSDLLFPGLSTVQTRAKYFLFIPWVYQRIEDERVSSSRAGDRARRYQTDLIYALEKGGASGGEGIIGWDSRKTLQRLPSAVYWSGLAVFGIRLFRGSTEEYHRSLDSYYERVRNYSKGEGDELAERLHPNWTYELPPIPDGLWDETTIELSAEQAHFLRERMMIRRPESLLAGLLQETDVDLDVVDAPWFHPAAPTLAEPTRTYLHHARLFAEVMNGAALAYNLMLAEHANEVGLSMGDTDLVSQYREDLDEWAGYLRSHWGRVGGWDISEFWRVVLEANPRIPHLTRVFVRHWIGATLDKPEHAASLPNELRSLITNRERRLKGARARLSNHRALEMWSGASGTSVMTYRWATARTMITDITQGLANA